jgi:hypothetical protein
LNQPIVDWRTAQFGVQPHESNQNLVSACTSPRNGIVLDPRRLAAPGRGLKVIANCVDVTQYRDR